MPSGDPINWLRRQWDSHAYLQLVVRRLGTTVFLLWGLTVITFLLTNAIPADPAAAALGEHASENPLVVQAYRQRFGLDKPLLVRYVDYLDRLRHGNLGDSFTTQQSVLDNLRTVVPATFELGVVAVALALPIGMALGVIAAANRDKWVDQLLRAVSLTGLSTPLFWLALLALYVFSFRFGLFPTGGRLYPASVPPPVVTGFITVDSLLQGDFGTFLEAIHHLILPAFVLALPLIGTLTRFARSAVLGVINQDFVTVARAKGLPEWTVLRRHVLRAALAPILTLSGILLVDAMTGSVLVEATFSWPGMGQYAYRSALSLDLNAIMGVTLLVGAMYVLANLVVDLLYGWIDPRTRLA